ncbi:MAG: DUF1566 domain-containing protein [Candidatus Electrothrix sp. AS4_5]|nr:DUF1566 domain-containing protein [Candidatus Electrothrix gigas]
MAEKAEKRYAILIGSSKYPNEPGLTELRCPEKDVDALNAVLRSSDFGGFTKTFAFKNSPSHEILEKIETVLADAGREDLVLIYFSGHGKLNPAGQLCLATVNTKIKALGSTSIPVSWIKSYFDHSASQKKILLLDCCYSGAVGKDFIRGGVDDQLQLMSRGQGTFIMTASSGIQTAVEKEGDQYGLFTKYLVYGIQSGEADKDEDGFVDMQELYEYVHEKVREEGAQEPMKWDLHVKGKLLISRSGKAPREKQLREAKSTLFRLAAEERLTESIVFEAVKVLSIPRQEMTAKDQDCCLLVRQLVSAKISPPAFIEQWVRACFTHPAAPAPEEKAAVSVKPVRFIEQWMRACLARPAAPAPSKETRIGQYIDHGNGTITDTKTGLMWKRCLEGLSGVNCEEGKVKIYRWNDAVKRCKNVEYAGYADWRLPTIEELKTLVHCSKGVNRKNGLCNKGSEKPTINQQAFPNTEAVRVWSGSPYADYSGSAWLVGFNFGYSSANRNGSCAVRLVRGGQ